MAELHFCCCCRCCAVNVVYVSSCVVVVVSLTVAGLFVVVLLQPAGEGGAGDVEGDWDLLRHLSDQADGATAGLPVGETHSGPCW